LCYRNLLDLDPDVIYALVSLYVKRRLTGVSADQGKHIVEIEVAEILVHGELHICNPLFTKIVEFNLFLVVLEKVCLRLVEIHDEIIKVFPGDIAGGITVVLLPTSNKDLDI
jgi:hypothetical protein